MNQYEEQKQKVQQLEKKLERLKDRNRQLESPGHRIEVRYVEKVLRLEREKLKRLDKEQE